MRGNGPAATPAYQVWGSVLVMLDLLGTALLLPALLSWLLLLPLPLYRLLVGLYDRAVAAGCADDPCLSYMAVDHQRMDPAHIDDSHHFLAQVAERALRHHPVQAEILHENAVVADGCERLSPCPVAEMETGDDDLEHCSKSVPWSAGRRLVRQPRPLLPVQEGPDRCDMGHVVRLIGGGVPEEAPFEIIICEQVKLTSSAIDGSFHSKASFSFCFWSNESYHIWRLLSIYCNELIEYYIAISELSPTSDPGLAGLTACLLFKVHDYSSWSEF